jgi:AsmA protein
MNKYLKYSLYGTGAVVGVAVAGVAYLAATFNPNDYKSQIIKAVKESKQRDLRLDGDISLSFYPNIGVNISKVSLSEHNSDKQFAALESARVSLALMPLLARQVVVNEVSLSGLQATLAKHKDGSTNIDDLLGQQEEKAAEKKPESKQLGGFDIAALSVEKTALTYRDEGGGAQYTLKDVTLHSGRIATGVPVKLDMSFNVQANQPKLDINTQLKTTLTFDPGKQLYQLDGLDLQAKGAALDMSDLVLTANGDAGADLSAQRFNTRKLTVVVNGKKGADSFEAKLEAPQIEMTKDGFSGDKLALSAKLKGANDITATLALPSIQGNARAFGSKALTLAMDAKGDALPGKQVKSEMKGSFAFDADKEHVEVELAGGLLQSQVKAKVAVNGFAKPAIRFDVDVDQFDADLYLPKKSADAAQPGASKPNQPEQPLDLSALRRLNLDGSLRIGALKVANIKSTNLRMDVKAHNGQMNIAPLSANLYQGSMNGSLSVNAKAAPLIGINQNLSGVNVAALTKDAAGFDTLEGKGNIGMNLTMQGNTVGAMKKALNGTLSLNLADGAIKGINIAKSLREFGKFGAAKTQDANQAEKTDFSELKASFKVNDGVAHNDDLSLKSPLLRLSGNGDIDIGNDSMNYLAKATLAKTLEGQGGKDMVAGLTVPVRISGPFDGLKYTLDFGAMVGEATKQKVEAKKEEVKTKLQDKLKGLFR